MTANEYNTSKIFQYFFIFQEIKDIYKDYNSILSDDYADEQKEWAIVKMIDFAHVFPAEDDGLDENYLFGIENLVKIFQEFFDECDQ